MTTLKDIELWLEANEDNLGYHILTKEEIVESIIVAENSEMDEYEKDEVDDSIKSKPKIGKIKNHLNIALKYVEDNDDENISTYYEHLRHLLELFLIEINAKGKQ